MLELDLLEYKGVRGGVRDDTRHNSLVISEQEHAQ